MSHIPLRRVRAAEMFPIKYSGNFKSSPADGRITQPPSPFCVGRTRNRRSRCITWSDEIIDDALGDNDADDGRDAELQDNEEVAQEPVEPDDLQDDVAPLGGRIDADKVPEDESYRDYWTLNSDLLIIHHLKPRWKLFDPSNEYILPIPLEYIDVTRNTVTDLDDASEARIKDAWYDNADASRKLSCSWTGQTRFNLLHPKPPKGFAWQDGRLTELQKTTRPPTVNVELWQFMDKHQRREERS